jgi:membrane protease YdiL (CAAX protease family)
VTAQIPAPVLALLQSVGGSAWGPLTMLAAGLYGSAVVLCFVIGGGFLTSGMLGPRNVSRGVDWIVRGFVGGFFGLLAGSIYLFFDGMF